MPACNENDEVIYQANARVTDDKMSTTSYIIVFVTTANKAEAEKISQALLQEKLIACANIVNPVTSFFHWKGKVDYAEECLVVMKSRRDLFSSLTEQVKALHSYEVPEILALPVVEGSAEYLEWMLKVLK
jgi:periplasmic divalent cation tolerance protein